MEEQIISSSQFIAFALYTIIVFILLVIVLILFFYFSRKKIIKKEIEKKNLQISYQKELLHSVILTQESERRRIAQDLHDDISSKLNVVSLNAHLLSSKNISDEEKNEISANIIDLTLKALESSRSIAHDLSPPVLEKFGLHAGIKELVSEYNSTKKIIVEYSNQLNFSKVNQDNQTHIFRILQELLNNSVKHGKASNATIKFTGAENDILFYYSDNGIGFNYKNSNLKKGLGLSNIESRVDFLGGNLQIKSNLKEGIEVTFKITNHETIN